jgi:hypothetical protein
MPALPAQNDHQPGTPRQPVQQAHGKGITGTCRVYLASCNGIHVHFEMEDDRSAPEPEPVVYA